ncbi:MAG TPA: ThiF family adenylyltransferase, partial [Elusimicrobiota bacterium]|nr:ThiF family adenylyltransferase [Elusimicrobiota bacterium]
MTFSESDTQRYARQLILPQVGEAGQNRLRAAKVLCVGAGGLGSAVAYYLTAAGVGTLGLLDNDAV